MSVAVVEKKCLRCGGQRTGTKYCKPCSAAVTRERGMHPERRKPCPECGKPKEPGRRRYCVACWEKRQPIIKLAERDRARFKSRRERLARGIVPRAPKVNEAGDVRCATCLHYLSPTQFRKVKQGGGREPRYHSQCNSCYSTYLHEHRLETLFGLTIEQYDALFEQQGGRCAICMRKPRTRRLAVDHSHESGEVRGLLCTRCNHKVLGAANESAALLRRAARYLEAPPAKTGRPIESLGEADDQGWTAFLEAVEDLGPGELEAYRGLVGCSMETLRALCQAAGFALVVEGERISPNPQLAIDDFAVLQKAYESADRLIAAGYIPNGATA